MPKQGIHPNNEKIRVVCDCAHSFETRSTNKGDIHMEICSNCHPFFHRQAEDDRHRRSCGALPSQVCAVGLRAKAETATGTTKLLTAYAF